MVAHVDLAQGNSIAIVLDVLLYALSALDDRSHVWILGQGHGVLWDVVHLLGHARRDVLLHLLLLHLLLVLLLLLLLMLLLLMLLLLLLLLLLNLLLHHVWRRH
jgi:hypothetical protein